MNNIPVMDLEVELSDYEDSDTDSTAASRPESPDPVEMFESIHDQLTCFDTTTGTCKVLTLRDARDRIQTGLQLAFKKIEDCQARNDHIAEAELRHEVCMELEALEHVLLACQKVQNHVRDQVTDDEGRRREEKPKAKFEIVENDTVKGENESMQTVKSEDNVLTRKAVKGEGTAAKRRYKAKTSNKLMRAWPAFLRNHAPGVAQVDYHPGRKTTLQAIPPALKDLLMHRYNEILATRAALTGEVDEPCENPFARQLQNGAMWKQQVFFPHSAEETAKQVLTGMIATEPSLPDLARRIPGYSALPERDERDRKSEAREPLHHLRRPGFHRPTRVREDESTTFLVPEDERTVHGREDTMEITWLERWN